MSQQLVRFINFGIAPDAPEKPDHGRRLYLLPSGDFATIDDAGVVTPLATDWDSITGKPSVFPPEAHFHTAADITDFASAVVAVSPPVDWSSLTGKPTEFQPSAHTHPANQITGLSDFIIASAPGLSITTTVHTATGATDTYSVNGLASSDPAHVLVQLNGVTQTAVTDYLIDFPNGLIIFDGIPTAGTQIALTALGLRTVQPPIDPTLYRYASDTSLDGLTNYYGRIANPDYTGPSSASDPVWTIHRTTFDPAGRVVSTGTATAVAWANRTTATYTATP